MNYANLIFFGARKGAVIYNPHFMNYRIPLMFLLIAAHCLAEDTTVQPRIRVGDSVIAVRNYLGEPRIEFPLHGQLIQDYKHCIITSKNGAVVSIQYRGEPPEKAVVQTEQSKAATVAKVLLAKAEKGDVDSQYRLAYCYQSGTGVERNSSECIRWYTVAAMQGHAAAQHNLGVLYLSGNQVDRDYEQAYTWGVLAAENGNDTLTKALLPRLTAEQELTGRLRAWRIRDGLEPLPYGSPDGSVSIAKKKTDSSYGAAD